MGYGYRNTFQEFIDDPVGGIYDSNTDSIMASPRRRRKKVTRHRKKNIHMGKSSRRRTRKRKVRGTSTRKTRKGSRRNPTWLKKYQFKKGHKRR